MNRLRFSLLAALCIIVPQSGVLAAPVPAARSGLEQVPATAPIVIHIRGVEGIHARLETMLQNALPNVLKKIKPHLDDFFTNGPDNVLQGRKLSGLPKDGPIFLVFTELPKPNDAGEPKMAIVLAVNNYTEFRDNILTEEQRKNKKDEGEGVESVTFASKPVFFVNRKGYAVVTPDKEVATTFTKKITGLDSRLSKEQAAKMLASDLGFYVNMEILNKDYAEQIKEAREGIQQVLALGTGAGDESQKKIAEMVKKAIGPIFQAVEDMRAVLTTIEFRPGGLALHIQSEMRDGTTTANLLQDSRPLALKDMERLPAGQAYYMGMKTSSALYKGLGSLMVGVPLGKAGEDSKDVANALEEMAKAGPIDRLDGYGFPLSGLQVFHYDEPAKALAAQMKIFKALAEGDPKTMGLREKPELKTDAQEHGGYKLNSIELAWDFDKMAEPIAQRGDEAKKQFIEAMKHVMGDKVTIWFGTDGKTVVNVSAPNWETARKLLDQYSKSSDTVGAENAFRDARKEMPAQTSFLTLVDPVRTAGTLVDAFRPLVPAQLPPGWPQMPAKGATTGFVGLSVTLQPSRGAFDLFITAAAAREVYKAFVQPLVGE